MEIKTLVMENLIASAENKFTDMETKIIDGGNKITSADKLFLQVTNETARPIHQRIPLPFQSRARLYLIVCGFVKRAEAAQGFSRHVQCTASPTGKRSVRVNCKSSPLLNTEGTAGNIRLNAIFKKGVMSLSVVFSYFFSLALMQKMRTTFGYSSRIYCSHFLRDMTASPFPFLKTALTPSSLAAMPFHILRFNVNGVN